MPVDVETALVCVPTPQTVASPLLRRRLRSLIVRAPVKLLVLTSIGHMPVIARIIWEVLLHAVTQPSMSMAIATRCIAC